MTPTVQDEKAVQLATLQPVLSDQRQLDLLKRTLAKDLTNDEFNLYIEVCRHKRLDPFARQIYAIKRRDNESGQSTVTFQTGIDGLRLQAERSGKYAGQTPIEWCDGTGKWVEVWLSNKPPAAARAGVFRTDFQTPLYAVALYAEFMPPGKKRQDGSYAVSPMWSKMPANQLAKCAEAAALRKAFPEECGNLYTPEEMARGDVEENHFKAMLQAFATLKEEVGNEIYYNGLAAHGFKHANEIRDMKLGRQIYTSIVALAAELRAKQQATANAQAASSPEPEKTAVEAEAESVDAENEWSDWDKQHGQ